MTPQSPFPLGLTGELDPDVSRWNWLIKWLLAIPHFIVLVFLWIGFALSTVVAGFAILFTGRYPRRIFDFNVGVLRWSWRVGFYTYSALGTDKYGRSGLPGATRGRLSRAALARARPDQVVATGDPPLPDRRHLHRRSVVCLVR